MLIDLNDPKNAASRGDVPADVRWLVEVPYIVGVKEPEYANFGDHWIDQRAFLGDGPFSTPANKYAVDEASDMDMTFARPATAAEIAAHCPEIPDGSSCLRETLEAVLAYLDTRTRVFIPDKNDFFAACKIRGTVIATLKESHRANAH